MTYSSLDTIPYKLFVKIAETGDVSLLSDVENNQITTIQEQLAKVDILYEIWNKLYDEHLSKNQTTESKKIFKLSKEIDSLLTLNKVVLMACECLRFEYNQELFNMITGFGYKLSITDTELYHGDLELIEREANAYIIKAENYKNMMPEKKEGGNNEYNVDDVMASYSAILGFNIGDFNVITYNAFYGYEKQVSAKINSINQQNKK